MKHSTFLKFVCIVLCAASILTLAGSGLGIWAMVEMDLYDKTVDQFLEDDYREDAQYHAYALARRYAGHTLGSLPKDFLENHYSSWFELRFEEGGFGYTLSDGDGNILEQVNPEIQSYAHKSYAFSIEGNYMHMVHAEPVPQEAPEEYSGLAEGEYGIIDRVGEGTVPVYFLQISHEGGSEGIGSPSPLGYLERLADGSIQFQANDVFDFQASGDTAITRITFMDMDEHILYEVADEHPVAIITAGPEGRHSIHLLKENEEPVSIQIGTPVYQAIFYGADGVTPIEHLKGTQPIGSASLDQDGNLNFQLYYQVGSLKGVSVYSLVLLGEDGTVLFGEANPQLRAATTDGVTFSSHPDAVIAAMPPETVPVETAPEEAIPETASEEGAGEAAGEIDAQAAETQAEPAGEGAPAVVADGEPIPVDTIPSTVPETVPETIPETVPVTTMETIPEATAETLPEVTEPDYRDMEVSGKSVREYSIDTYQYYDPETNQLMDAKVIYVAMPPYTVEILVQPELDRNVYVYTLMELLRSLSGLLLPLLLGSLAILALTVVYLCVAAGHRRTGEIKAGGLNRIPLELYAFLAGSAIAGLGGLTLVTCSDLLPRNWEVSLVLIPLMCYLICLIFVGFCFAVVAQCKTPGGYWWRNSLCGRLLTGGVGSLGKFGDWIGHKFFPWLWRMVCAVWDLCLLILEGIYKILRRIWRKSKALVHDFLRWIFYAIRRFFSLLPLSWQWVLAGLLLLFLGILVWANRNDGWGFLWFLVGMALVLYVSRCFGVLLERTKKMNQGDLDSKIDNKKMVGCFQEFASDLNSLADVVVVAAQKQLRSERMKTELITNVSHDIKTPLTSIINYVDLLQKPHTEEEGEQYLEVLDRQSQRLKKLIDDLMDMSKANTGNMHVEITRLDAVESVNQALGEFGDKLEKAELIPVFRHNTDEAFIMADGKLVWRVLSNLLSNAVKYAMPGTRLYLDLMNLDGRVILSLKNISRDPLNVDAEELMERFVRGDAARNTDGSGLGLNIAKSLMELQKGHLQLLVDGDLFKVTLVFPTAE